MKSIRCILPWLGLLAVNQLFAQALPTASPESVGISSERLQRLEDAIEREILQERMPGAVIAIARRDKLIYFEAFGYLDKENDIPMSKDAVFAIASMTKPVFAAGAMSLYEEGRLQMHEPVGAYLPELADRLVATDDAGNLTEAARRQPTIQDLMLHTGGFAGRGNTELHELYPVAIVNERISRQEFLARLADLPLRYQPGTTWEYGISFDILGFAIERVSAQGAYEFLSERLFEPLGMADTVFTLSSEQAARQAQVLPIDPITGERQQTRNMVDPWPFDCGSGCLASTAMDYLAFAQMLLNGGELNGTRVLAPKTVEYMISDHIGPDIDMSRLHLTATVPAYGYGHGLGGVVRRSAGLGNRMGSAGEYYWVGSQGTGFLIDPAEELALVYMAQTPGEIRGYYRQLIPTLVYQALMD